MNMPGSGNIASKLNHFNPYFKWDAPELTNTPVLPPVYLLLFFRNLVRKARRPGIKYTNARDFLQHNVTFQNS